MAKLILSMDGLVLKEITLSKERTTIGRKPHNDIQIDNLAVSGEHAVIVTILNDSFLEDLGSTNGTLVNAQPIKKHFLQNNDIVELGKYRLKYLNEAGAGASKAQDFEKTMVLRPATPKGGAAKPLSESQSMRVISTSQPMRTLESPQELNASGSGTVSTSQPMPAFGDALRMDPQFGAEAGPFTNGGAPHNSAPMNLSGDPLNLMGLSQPHAVIPPPGLAPNMSISQPQSLQDVTTRANPVASMPSVPGMLTSQEIALMRPTHHMAAIQILSGSNAGRELEIVKPLTTVGKPGVQVAVITKRPQGYFITHVEGAEHPIVNGRMLDSQACPLHDHDVVEIAGVKLEFYFKS